MPKLPETRGNIARKVVIGEVQNSEIPDLRERLRDGTHEEVLREVEVLKISTRGEIGGEGGVDEVVEER